MLTSAVQMRAAMQMRDEIFLHRSSQGYQSSGPATYKISVDEALEVVRWFEKQQEELTEVAITAAVQSYSTGKESDERQTHAC